jgi:hypothetical protein
MNTVSPDQVIGVHIGNPLLQLRPEFAPADNSVGFVLLHRMLELALLAGELTGNDCCGASGAYLNDCIFIARVTDPTAAGETIKNELGRVGLLSHSQIGVLEGASWRCLYPSANVRLGWLMDEERLEFAAVKFSQAQDDQLKLIREAFAQMQRENGQQGDKQ